MIRIKREDSSIIRMVLPHELDGIDWDRVWTPRGHPFPFRLNSTQIIRRDTGDVVAIMNPDYELYLAHDHIHVCLAGFQGDGGEYRPCRVDRATEKLVKRARTGS